MGVATKVGVLVGVDKMLINKYINKYMLIKNYNCKISTRDRVRVRNTPTRIINNDTPQIIISHAYCMPKKLVRPKPDQPNRLIQPCTVTHISDITRFTSSGTQAVMSVKNAMSASVTKLNHL